MPSSRPLAVALSLAILACAGPAAPATSDPGTPSEAEHEEAMPAAPTPPAHPDRIRVVDAEGSPVGAASVVILDPGYTLRAGTIEAPLVAGDDGWISLGVLAVDEPIALAWAPGHAAAHLELAPGADTLVLGPATPLVGRVEGSGRVEHVWLQAAEPEAPWPYFVRCDVDEEGRFRVEGLAAGRFTVTSVPIGSAPVLGADVEGRVQLLGTEPEHVEPVSYRFLDREIPADGGEHVLRAAFGDATIVGSVVDEEGHPVAGAVLRASDESERDVRASTDERGHFELPFAATPYVFVRAGHDAFGDQSTDREWNGWIWSGPIPDAPITLTLRRGVVLSGVVTRPEGAPFASADLLLVPAYVGSGPRTITTHTDAMGHFAFDRMVLGQFDLVPEGLAHWHPTEPGRYLRARAPSPADWVRAATEGRAVALALEGVELVPVSIEVGHRPVQVWTRWGEDLYAGSAPRIVGGRVRITMERGRAHELWVEPYAGSLEAPFDRAADWTGTPEGPLSITAVP